MAGQEQGFSHLDESGAARMVDVSGKDITAREAVAAGRVLVSAEVVELLRGPGVPKGDALSVARIAGIQAVKRTPELIPLAHPIAVHGVEVDLAVADDGVDVVATVRTADRTGIEMEALTAVAVASLYGESGTAKLLVLSQVVLSLQLPFAVVHLVSFTSNHKLMGGFVNPAWLKVAAWLISAVIIGLNLKLLFNFVLS